MNDNDRFGSQWLRGGKLRGRKRNRASSQTVTFVPSNTNELSPEKKRKAYPTRDESHSNGTNSDQPFVSTLNRSKLGSIHKTVGIFCNHLLDGFDDENRKLRQSTKLLKAAVVDIFTKVELRLRDGSVYITEFKEDSLSRIPIASYPRPLMDFMSAEVRMMGQTVGTMFMLGYQPLHQRRTIDGRICLNFNVSPQCTVKGYLDGLSDKDYAGFLADTAHAERHISLYLQTGFGLQNGTAVTFTPTAFVLKISRTLSSLDQLPSREIVKNELMSKLAAKSSRDDGLVCLVKNEFEHQSEDLILSTLAAFGHTDHMLNVLAENRMLRTENSVLRQVQEMFGTVEISHPGFNVKALLKERFNVKAFLKDGRLDNNEEGVLVWRIDLTEYATPLSITIDNITSLKVSVSGIRIVPRTQHFSINPSWNGIDVDGFSMTLDNGIRIDGSVYSTDSDSFLNSVGDVDITVDLPLSFIQNTLVALGLSD